ncbi:protein-disulfide reductase DsbD family protein [Aliidiomarina maris]|uniref:Thiol:disulfide interchange protein n=1 Tax=Aliidiomarina maris TaxID=531312 RepID=A0A327WSQ2_9GAMM|nr:protein-disulfide reductase DsbD domain-containing protein [Aliidiomarina maris]RAJ94910.1 thiol:disulfide interchange protein DsbD [Aliidiomarina maris]RUO20489.1 thiol:disulfide interchange protein [Aliidiomarina maris]
MRAKQHPIRFFMRVSTVLWLGLAILITSATAAEVNSPTRSPVVEQPHLDAQLLTEHSTVAAGESFWVSVKLVPEQGWHTYWINPGDSGLATQIEWQLPDGVEVGPIVWPTAEKYRIGPLANYGFEGPTYLLQRIHIAADYSHDSLELSNRVDWLVCEEYCIPGHAELSLQLPLANESVVATDNQDSFAQARNNLPEPVEWPIFYDVDGNTVTFMVEHADAVAMANDGDFYLFAGAGELVEHAEQGQVEISDNTLIVQRTRNAYYYGVDGDFPVQLVNSERAVELRARPVAESGMPSDSRQSSTGSPRLALVLTFAFLGGLILNLMPCVFPVLSLKALAVANHAERRLADSLWYSLGVIATFVAIAALLLALRASGAALGWGFQLQSPWLIALLALLFTAIGLNLSGLYQMATSVSRLGNMASGSAQSGARQSFATGVLAVVIASPCTAPFMGVALGFAIVQPAPIALLVFAVLGLGLAFPFLLLGVIPGAARILPKPGAWMDSFKQWMAIPMYLTVVWLLWVFTRQAGANAQAMLLVALVLMAASLWLYGRQQMGSGKAVINRIVLLVMLLLTAASGYAAIALQTTSGTSAAQAQNQHWQAWSPDSLHSAREQGPVFVNMTADWCITCLANERVALNTDSTRTLFNDYNITYLKGDWTLQDPAITEYLAQYGRNGVPLYVIYWPGEDPQVLPQILTNNLVRERIQLLADPV